MGLVCISFKLNLCYSFLFFRRYFPYHYAPFASDFLNFKDVTVLFEGKTKPFNILSYPHVSKSEHYKMPQIVTNIRT